MTLPYRPSRHGSARARALATGLHPSHAWVVWDDADCVIELHGIPWCAMCGAQADFCLFSGESAGPDTEGTDRCPRVWPDEDVEDE